MCIRDSFDNLLLKKLYCEPYALNPAPNKTVEKIGFTFIKEHISVPGSLNFEQLTKLWELSYDDFKQLKWIPKICLLYTSDAADERSSVDLGGRRIF